MTDETPEEPLELDAAPTGIDLSAWWDHALLTPEEMRQADQAAMTGGISGYDLMTAAGRAAANAVSERFAPGTVAILCGPGNNGGDGFVAAQFLASAGWSVRVGLLGQADALTGDAARAAADWSGAVAPLSPDLLNGVDVVVDAVFGAGLNRPPEGAAAATFAALGDLPVIAVDMPSGVSGDSGASLAGAVPKALSTVTFFRGKPGHYLLPGRIACGNTILADIGIPATALAAIGPRAALNHPDLWRDALPTVDAFSHKYSRGHVLVAGGAELIGAACLTARAAQRAGAGIVTVAAPVQQGPLYRLALESAVVRSIKDTRAFNELVEDPRIGCCAIGPGLGVGAPGSVEKVLGVLRTGRPAVLDADALTLFGESPAALFDALSTSVLLTPHDGEFRRLFPDLAALPDKVDRARCAAARCGAVVLLKGYDTVIADPDGWAVINANAPPHLATAGAGDVLAGLAAALIAGGMPVFAAAAAASYLHGAAAADFGPGLIASDLPDRLPQAIESARS